ncbi:hypothetical protein L1987_59452 [Smallanthus sonchifolius]|uniref:Uncharacterized protein n=1 Tax=Smallanthus sonchifolius TaxID=185202 RepID=A0ACB9D5J4_9ASTR|nr:hypothetical protein L1987_59452 [Smallanthus sonchifolius]
MISGLSYFRNSLEYFVHFSWNLQENSRKLHVTEFFFDMFGAVLSMYLVFRPASLMLQMMKQLGAATLEYVGD